MTEEEKKRKYQIAVSGFQPGSNTKYNSKNITREFTDKEFADYQRHADLLTQAKKIQDRALYAKYKKDDTGGQYFNSDNLQDYLKPEEFATAAGAQNYNVDDYYNSVKYMNDLASSDYDENFNISLAGSKEGYNLDNQIRKQNLGQQHYATNFGAGELIPDTRNVNRTGEQPFNLKIGQKRVYDPEGVGDRSTKLVDTYKNQSLAYPVYLEALEAGKISEDQRWVDNDAVGQSGFQSGDEQYNIENTMKDGVSTATVPIDSPVKTPSKVIQGLNPYGPNSSPIIKAYGGDMNYYGTGGQFSQIGGKVLQGAGTLVGNIPGPGQGLGALFGGLGAGWENIGDQRVAATAMGEDLSLGDINYKDVGKEAAFGAASGALGVAGKVAVGALEKGIDSTYEDSVEKMQNQMESDESQLYNQNQQNIAMTDQAIGTMTDMGQDAINSDAFSDTSFGAYGGNMYAEGGFMQPTIDPANRKTYEKDLKSQENDAKVGYNNTSKLWKPYIATEDSDVKEKDRTYDIGYGNKLGKLKDGKLMVDIDGKKVNAMDGLTDAQNESLFKNSITSHEDAARKQWNERYPNSTQYDDLSQNKQILITDYSYNLGNISKFPNFMDALSENDEKKAYNQYKRYSKGNPLTKRNKWSKEKLNELFPNHKNSISVKNNIITKSDTAKITAPTTITEDFVTPGYTEEVSESTNIANQNHIRRQAILDNARKALEESKANTNKRNDALDKFNNLAYGGNMNPYGEIPTEQLQSMPTMTPGQIPIDTPGIQSHVNYDPEVLQGRMEKLYNPQRNAGRSTHLNQDTGERGNANFFGDLFKPNTRRTSVEGGQYANGGNIDNLYQAGGNLTEYNGNTHEVGGIPLGNTNNEVEDGEIRWDTPDGEAYIFSNRIPYTKSKKK